MISNIQGFSLFEETKKAEPVEVVKEEKRIVGEEEIRFPAATFPEIVKSKEEMQIASVELDSVSVTEVMGAVAIEPVILYVKIEEDKNPVGIFGFFDQTKNMFFQLDGSPVTAKGFEKAFQSFLKNRPPK